jgi:altronate dehydratase large subunit
MKFNGYRRPDGRAGVRNHVVVMPGVLCAEVAARKIAAKADGVTFIYNPNGCGQCHKDTTVTLDILSGLIANGNVYGALIVGLGCETIGERAYIDAISAKTNKPVHYICIQREGGIGKTVEKGLTIAAALKKDADSCVREEIDLSELILGLECGGSDPTSGISANVVLGEVCDRIIDMGGTAVLSETPEAVGAEHILRDRGKTPEIGQAIYDAVIRFEQDCLMGSGEDVRLNNPSPGNKEGGLTTLSEKSLGCIHKSGTRPFDGLYEYGQLIDEKGLFFLNATAFDVPNVTALAAAGAQVVAFTTGLGNPVGNPVAPVVKITGNHETAERMNDFIDFDTSGSITGAKPVEQLGKELLEFITEVCNGTPVKAEENGACEIAINQKYSYV